MVNDFSAIHPGIAIPRSMIDALEDASRVLQVAGDLEHTLRSVSLTATEVVGGCEVASLTMRGRAGFETRSASAPLAVQVDHMQYEAGEGPCLDAVESRLVHSPDPSTDERWPAFARRVVAVGEVGEVVSCQLAVGPFRARRPLGSLNLYATRSGGFTEADQLLAALFATHAALVIDACERDLQLREAVESRDVIGQAKGILMAGGGVDPEDAFTQLRMASQRMNVKLRDLARQVVEGRRGREGTVSPSSTDTDGGQG